MKNIELGAGLIGIGRTWGYKESAVPLENAALAYLSAAYQVGIRFFDTAPAYGSSEERLGKFIQNLSSEQKSGITIATKFGEHWDVKNKSTYVDHSYKALTQSLDQSLKHLGKIHLLQIHKATPEVLDSPDMKKALFYAKEKGIQHFGVSVNDINTAKKVCDNDFFSTLQFPFNESNQTFLEVIKTAQDKGKTVIINRPFNMGAILYEIKTKQTSEEQKIHAYSFILDNLQLKGIILTGTKSAKHLTENHNAFLKAKLTKR